MAKLGLDSFSYRVHLADTETSRDVFWFIDRAVELGLDGCQFDPMHLDGWREPLVRQIAAACERRGLYLELGSGGFVYDHLAPRLELAAEVGARAMRTFITGERHRESEQRLNEMIQLAIENFKRLAENAERLGVPVALENHEDLTSTEIIHILDAVDSPYIRALIDTGNGLPLGEDPLDCVGALIPYAAATHFKDWKVRIQDGLPIREGCPLGHGDARAAEVYSLLRAALPDLPITIELPSIRPDNSPQTLAEEDANVVESVRFARSLEGERVP